MDMLFIVKKYFFMKRKLILSQEQLDEICNGDSSYLDDLSTNPDMCDDIHANEITVGGGLVDGYGEPFTTDRVADTEAPKNGLWGLRMGRGDYTRVVECKKKDWIKKHRLNEINQAIKGQNITATVGDGPDSYQITGSENKLNTQRYRAELAGDDEKVDAINKALDNRRRPVENRKKNLKDMGIENAYQKPGGKKDSGNGKAHTIKGANGTNSIIRYW